MARPKRISDADILMQAVTLWAEGGDKALSFGNLARVSGLAAATLAQRYGDVDGLRTATLMQGWDMALACLVRCEAAMPANGRNAVAFLKALAQELPAVPVSLLLASSGANKDLLHRASLWRQAVESALRPRIEAPLGQLPEAVAMLFAAWQGRMAWAQTEGEDFRLRSLLKRGPG